MSKPKKIEKIEFLTVRDANVLLTVGIPVRDLPKYKDAIVGSNIRFWDQLVIEDRSGLLEERGGKVCRRERLHIKSPQAGPIPSPA